MAEPPSPKLTMPLMSDAPQAKDGSPADAVPREGVDTSCKPLLTLQVVAQDLNAELSLRMAVLLDCPAAGA